MKTENIIHVKIKGLKVMLANTLPIKYDLFLWK